MKARTLKVSDLWRGGRYYENLVPQIRLNGKWLKEAGFEIGDEVYIIPEEQGRLVVITSRDYTEEVRREHFVPELPAPARNSLRPDSYPAVQQLQLL